MDTKKKIIENMTRDDVKYYETKLGNNLKKKSKKKVSQDDFSIPSIKDYNNVLIFNYNVAQLKIIAKNYKIKVSGNKNELNKRIYLYLLYNYHSIQIQKNVRRKFVYKYIAAHGPAFIQKDQCVNDRDFLSLEDIGEINYVNFYSVEDGDKIYAFNVVSLYNYIRKEKMSGKNIKNPFTNCEFSNDRIYHKVKRFIKLSRLINTGLNINSIEEENNSNTLTEMFDHQVHSLFHYIDSLGNYTSADWFLNLSRHQLVKFIREIHDIWNYRAELSDQAKRNICSPNGNPFICRRRGIHLILINDMISTDIVRLRALDVMENMVRYSRNPENSAIGCYYLLGALTLVSSSAAEALPWLYQCMYHS